MNYIKFLESFLLLTNCKTHLQHFTTRFPLGCNRNKKKELKKSKMKLLNRILINNTQNLRKIFLSVHLQLTKNPYYYQSSIYYLL